MLVQVQLVKAFSQSKTGGNPAGVILEADKLSNRKMLHISQKLGYSESVFVQTSAKADFKFRFFSRTQEVNLCIHATIAAFHTLAKHKLGSYTI